jgi:hypothetical protein
LNIRQRYQILRVISVAVDRDQRQYGQYQDHEQHRNTNLELNLSLHERAQHGSNHRHSIIILIGGFLFGCGAGGGPISGVRTGLAMPKKTTTPWPPPSFDSASSTFFERRRVSATTTPPLPLLRIYLHSVPGLAPRERKDIRAVP